MMLCTVWLHWLHWLPAESHIRLNQHTLLFSIYGQFRVLRKGSCDNWYNHGIVIIVCFFFQLRTTFFVNFMQKSTKHVHRICKNIRLKDFVSSCFKLSLKPTFYEDVTFVGWGKREHTYTKTRFVKYIWPVHLSLRNMIFGFVC